MQIPKKAKKVFQGTIFSVYQWKQKMFDGTIETFEMLKRPNTIQIIPIQGDKIIVSRQSQPHKFDYFSLFGGRAEEGEEPLITAKRELLEESGLVSDDWELFNTYSFPHKIQWDVYFFIARNCKKIADPKLDPGEKIQIIEYSFDEFQKAIEDDNYLAKDLALDILKIEKAGKLEEFKKRLFRSYRT